MTDQKDPVLEAEIERALAPYKALLPPDMLEVFRAELERALTQDPVGKRLLRAVKPTQAVDHSGDVPTTGAADEASKKKESGGKR